MYYVDFVCRPQPAEIFRRAYLHLMGDIYDDKYWRKDWYRWTTGMAGLPHYVTSYLREDA